MKKESYIPLKVFLWLICVYHLIVGITGSFFHHLAPQVAPLLYGVELTLTPQIQLIIIHLGALAIIIAILMAFAAIDPVKNKSIIYAGIVYFAIRIIDRVVFWKLIEEHKSAAFPDWVSINWIGIFLMSIMMLGLFIFRPKNES